MASRPTKAAVKVGGRGAERKERREGLQARATAEGRNQMLRLGDTRSRERTMGCGVQLAASQGKCDARKPNETE